MAGSTQTAQAGKTGHATVNTNSQTHTSSEQLPVPTPLHYPCKICGKVFNKVKSRSAHMKSHRPIPSPDSAGQESKRPVQQSSVQQQQQQQQSNALAPARDYRQQMSSSNSDCNVSNRPTHLWHNPTRLRPP